MTSQGSSGSRTFNSSPGWSRRRVRSWNRPEQTQLLAQPNSFCMRPARPTDAQPDEGLPGRSTGPGTSAVLYHHIECLLPRALDVPLEALGLIRPRYQKREKQGVQSASSQPTRLLALAAEWRVRTGPAHSPSDLL